MKRPPFNRRIPVILVIAGTFMVLLSLGSFSVSVKRWTKESEISPASSIKEPVFPFEERAHAGLNWILEITLDHWLLHADLKDSSGQPVSGGEGQITLHWLGEKHSLALQETSPGRYVTELPRQTAEKIHALIRIDHRQGHIARRLLIAYGPGT